MFDFLKPKKQPAPRIHIIEPKPQMVNVKRATGGALRAGMWVVVQDRVGILKEMNEFAVCAVVGMAAPRVSWDVLRRAVRPLSTADPSQGVALQPRGVLAGPDAEHHGGVASPIARERIQLRPNRPS